MTHQDSVDNITRAIHQGGRRLVERESLVELIVLAAVAGEHVLVIGPPGTAKSEAVRRVASAIEARYFEYLVGRFTEPHEIFGPVDLQRLREGQVVTRTDGMLPEAQIAFLDEVFLGSTAILNTLLGILNERLFRRGHSVLECPLRICVGAANRIPDLEHLAAFADRFLVRVFVEPIPDPRLEELLEAGWAQQQAEAACCATVADLDQLAAVARRADMSAVRAPLAHALRLLSKAGVTLTDRRAVKVQSLIAAAAVLSGREQPTEADLWPLVAAIPTAEGQEVAREALGDLLDPSSSATLKNAAAAASLGSAARAALICDTGELVLSEQPEGDGRDREAWLLKLEGVAREIDASFAKESLPPEIDALRQRIVSKLHLGS